MDNYALVNAASPLENNSFEIKNICYNQRKKKFPPKFKQNFWAGRKKQNVFNHHN